MAEHKTCPKHPRRTVGADGCWDCLGRPPGWVCSVPECRKVLPCSHIQDMPAPSREAADRLRDLLDALDMYASGVLARSAVELRLREYEQALRTAWRRNLERRQMN